MSSLQLIGITAIQSGYIQRMYTETVMYSRTACTFLILLLLESGRIGYKTRKLYRSVNQPLHYSSYTNAFVFDVTIAFKLFTKNWKPWCVSSCLATSNVSHFYGRYFPLCGLPPLLYLSDLHLMSVQVFLDLKVSPLCVFSLYQLTET